MPRKRVSTVTTSEESVKPTIIESSTSEEIKEPLTVPDSSPQPEQPSVKGEEPASDVEVRLQPATFTMNGLTMRCQVCGFEAHRDNNQDLYCPNAHNHPPLITESDNS